MSQSSLPTSLRSVQPSPHMMLNHFKDSSETFRNVANRLFLKRPQVDVHLEGVTNLSLKAMVVAGVFQEHQCPIVVIASDPTVCVRYYQDLMEVLPEEQIGLFPSEDFSPYDLGIMPVKTLKEHFYLGCDLKKGLPKVYLMPAKSLVLRHRTVESLQSQAIRLEVNQEMSPQVLAKQCLERGYTKTSIILEPGEFSSRGDLFDLYPVSGDPVRIEFFGDTIENIRVIDTETQRSVSQTKEVQVIPRSMVQFNDENKEQLIQGLRDRLALQGKLLNEIEEEALRTTIDNQIQALEQDFMPDGLDYYAPLLDQPFELVSALMPDNAIVVYDDWVVIENDLVGYTDRLTRQFDEGKVKGRLLDLDFSYHVSAQEGLGALQQQVGKRLYLDSFPVTDAPEADKDVTHFMLPTQGPQAFKADLKEAAKAFQNLRRDGVHIYITTDNPQRVLDACKESDVPAVYCPEDGMPLDEAELEALNVIVARQGMTFGFWLEAENLIHFTDAELFSRRQKKLVISATSANKRQDADTIKSIDELREGDYVVHVKHGIGQFIKLDKIEFDGEFREYLTIEYKGKDKLFVPAEQVNLLSRYRGSGSVSPKLNKMGGIDWNKTKTKAQKSIRSIARDLMELYAARSRSRGFQFEPDSPWQVEMEESFPFTETPDQWQAILDLKSDMESEDPMDRLICGDVGFGKTEVAIRGIFKAVLSGKQVAVLVPTTILAQQHFNVISERFKPYPVKVGLLSRFRTPKEQKELVNRLILGECDVVVGTHRLLQRDIHFKDLGLVVVDEEHRFGVSHKEKLKQMRKEVDVLTLSATPIPRTLYMAMSGVRKMSLINTPPVNRAPVKTFVGPYNPAQLRMAILQEIDRGGQVFFLHNRVQTIYQKLEELQQLVPEVTFSVGHGQMGERELENVMLGFAEKEFDVLLCTTIIESGLDIPNANTMIVDNTDRFGLAQLYQIRGRVGRSEVQAYAYLYYDQDKILTTDAKERLRAIREFTTLGSGYQIALRDMEIRGVGNILGAEQHGHMVSIGFDMYCDLLQQSIDELQGKVVETKEDAIIDINVTAFIPDEWVGDKNVKLTEYKRLADVRSDRALDIIQAEWLDRFGDIPEETQQLVRLVKLRLMATQLGIPFIREDAEFLRFSVPYSLQEWMALQNKMLADIGRKARWVPAVTSKESSSPTLLVKLIALGKLSRLDYIEKLLEQLTKHDKKES